MSDIANIQNITLSDTDDNLLVHIPLKIIKRRNGRQHIVLPQSSNASFLILDIISDPLALAIAKGFLWQELIDNGTYSTMRELAEKIKLDVAYVARTIRLTLLAPDIIEAVMSGKRPLELTLERLSQKFPANWEEQRREWGLG